MTKGSRFLPALLILSLIGCKQAPLPPQLPDAFASEIAFTVHSLQGTAALRMEDGLELKFLSPETICGCRISVKEQEITLSYDDTVSALGDSLPDGALISVLHDALSAEEEGLQKTFADPGWEFSGTLPKAAGTFLLTVSDTGIPLELSAEHAGISVVFSDTEPLDPVPN